MQTQTEEKQMVSRRIEIEDTRSGDARYLIRDISGNEDPVIAGALNINGQHPLAFRGETLELAAGWKNDPIRIEFVNIHKAGVAFIYLPE